METNWIDTVLSRSDLNGLSDKGRSYSRSDRVGPIYTTPVMDCSDLPRAAVEEYVVTMFSST